MLKFLEKVYRTKLHGTGRQSTRIYFLYCLIRRIWNHQHETPHVPENHPQACANRAALADLAGRWLAGRKVAGALLDVYRICTLTLCVGTIGHIQYMCIVCVLMWCSHWRITHVHTCAIFSIYSYHIVIIYHRYTDTHTVCVHMCYVYVPTSILICIS